MVSKNQIKFVKSLELKKNRKREGLFVAEGPKVVGDLLRAGFQPHSIFATEEYAKLGVKYNYQHTNNDQVRLWNPTCKSFRISYDDWIKDYFIVDKWLKLN